MKSAPPAAAAPLRFPRSIPFPLPSFKGAAALAVVIGAFLFYTGFCFGIVPYIDIDIGMDFVAADLLLQGRTLYKDIHYGYGPFTPWFNSILFRVFDPSTSVLFAAGAVASLAIIVLTFLLARRILPPGIAAVASLVVLANAVYGPHLMSYAAPYTLAATYGLAFSLLTLWSAFQSLERSYSPWDWLTGTAAGFALVTKHDFGLISFGILCALLAFRWTRRRGRLLPSVLAGWISFAAVGAVFAALALRQVGVGQLLAVIYPTSYLDAVRYFNQSVHFWGPKALAGITESTVGLILNFSFILWATALVAAAFGLVRRPRPSGRILFTLIVLGLPFLWQRRYLGDFPLLLHAAVLAGVLLGWVRDFPRRVAFLALCAVIFLFRVLPAPKLSGYLFPLLYFIPSLVLYFYLFSGLVAPWLGRFFPANRIRAALAAVFLVCFVFYPFVRSTYPWFRQARLVNTERGSVRLGPAEASKVETVLAEIRRHTSPGDRILLVPHGTMCYFLSDRQPAGKYLFYSPGQLIDGPPEAEEIQRLTRTPPKLVIIDDLPQPWYFPGPVNRFGEAYNVALSRWIWQNYSEVRTVPYSGRPLRFLIPASPNSPASRHTP